MAKNIEHILHKRSGTAGNKPLSNQLSLGEIAVNYSVSGETLYIKNSNGVIVPFSANNQFKTINNQSLIGAGNIDIEPGLTIGSISGATVNSTGNKLNLSAMTSTVIADGYQHSSMNPTTAYTNQSGATTSADYDGILPTTGHPTVNDMMKLLEQEIVNIWKMLGKNNFDKTHYGESIYDLIADNEVVVSEALNDLNERVHALEGN